MRAGARYIPRVAFLAHLSKSSGWAIVVTLCLSSVVVLHPSSVINNWFVNTRSQFWPNVNETCPECLPLWNLGQVRYWVTWDQKLGHQVTSKEKLVNTLAVTFLAHLSTKCSWWAIVVSQCPSCVVHRPSSTIALRAYSSYNPGPIDWYLVGSTRVTCRSKIAKIVSIGNPRWPSWPPSWKSIFRFFSWTERPIDSKLARKHRGDL